MTSSAKDMKKAMVIQQVSNGCPLNTTEVAAHMMAGQPMSILFDLLYEQIEGLQETNLRLNDANTKLQQKADLASMKAQEYFVRLRDGKLLNQGETF